MTSLDVALINELIPMLAFTAFVGWFVSFSLKRPY